MDRILESKEIQSLICRSSRPFLTGLIREVLQSFRQEASQNSLDFSSSEEIWRILEIKIKQEFEAQGSPSQKRVINATGVLLHTNLGRAPLSREAVHQMTEIASGYSNLEYDLEQGQRGKRDTHLAQLLCKILGAEEGLTVNNNAAALFLILNTLAHGWEVLVSRGELVEIGDSFRIPDIIQKSGAHLREVGTTNCTHLRDYSDALTQQTRMILRIHPSNFRIQGFTAKTSLVDLAELSRQRGLLLVEDLGSGCLNDLRPYGIQDEPLASGILASGADLICFSGDKLLGGPQAGIIAGNRQLLQQIRHNPLYRALRLDRFRLAALEATFKAYLQNRTEEIPLFQMLNQTPISIEARARALIAAVNLPDEIVQWSFCDGLSVLGGGSTPEQGVPTRLLALRTPRFTPATMEQALRLSNPPVLARIEDDLLLFDLRTVFPDEENTLANVIHRILTTTNP